MNTSDGQLIESSVAIKQSAPLSPKISSNRLFWILNAMGWVGISLLTYFSLSLPYSQFELSYFAHNISQSLVGLLLTLPLRWCFKIVWPWPVVQRFTIAVLATIVFSMLWAVLRLLLFMLMTQEQNLWADYGGWVFPSIFVFFTWSALYHGIKYYQLLQQQREAMLVLESQQRQRALQLVRAKAEIKDAQLQLLRYQLNPHFLFNTLNSVASLVSVERNEDAKTMLSRLGDFLRYSLDAGDDMLIPLDKEFWALSQYLEIEQVRFSDRMKLEVDLPATLETLLVPNLLLQPLAENAIKYAIAPSEAGGTIRVSATLEDSKLVLCVEDSGSERLDNAVDMGKLIEMGEGIGLRNTRHRLRNHFATDFELHVRNSSLGGLCFTVTIPATESIREGAM
ncbi:histidine kinase [Luminiphilus sp.]|jgi:two-component system, LytTR family, sensor kinase|nr:histidine kinase [Luminiphilus sp.]MDG1011930.1 histidine kinase [Luminiphilus sp.]MDG2271434.1 histidine kinase [Halioglobus sp.]